MAHGVTLELIQFSKDHPPMREVNCVCGKLYSSHLTKAGAFRKTIKKGDHRPTSASPTRRYKQGWGHAKSSSAQTKKYPAAIFGPPRPSRRQRILAERKWIEQGKSARVPTAQEMHL